MKPPLISMLLLAAVLLTGCRSDSADAALRSRQARKIAELEGRLKRLQADAGDPGTATPKQVEEAQQSADQTEAYVKGKEEELLALESEFEKATREDEAYRRKYVVDASRLKPKP